MADLAGKQRPPGGVVWKVFPGGPAEAAGLRPGDILLSVNGHAVSDIIDVRFYAADDACVLGVLRDGKPLEIPVRKDIDDLLQVEFREDLFDGVRLCHNRCDFCFVRQQPPGMRSSLAIRDDDFRLSFLHGNFITLTNLTEADWQRIETQRLSPLHVSVHATDPDVRRRLLHNKRSGEVLQDLRRLTAHGIQVHTQVVLCQGLNDGAVLDRTIRDLSALYPRVASLAVVPMGVTDYRPVSNKSLPFDSRGAKQVVSQIRAWQRGFETSLGTRFAVPSDEFYLLAGRPFPRAYTYDGYPQLENGVGLSRVFMDDLARCRRRYSPVRNSRTGISVQLVTGTLAQGLVGTLAEFTSAVTGCRARVVAAENRWYGRSVTVAGLLTGSDVLTALREDGEADLVLVPDVMLRDDSPVFLDGMPVVELSRELQRPVIAVAPRPGEAVEALLRWGAGDDETSGLVDTPGQ